MESRTHRSKGAYLFLVIVIALVIAAAVIFWAVSTTRQQESKQQQPSSSRGSTSEAVAAVKVTDTGFEPAVLDVSPGTVVTWTNSGSNMHQIASNPHPKDDGLPGLNSSILNPDQAYEFTFTDKGSFGYHDELNPTLNGTIEVH